MSKKRKTATALVQTGLATDKAYGSVIPPIYLSSTFQIQDLDNRGAYEYSRTRNPSRDILAQLITELESGLGTCITSSGMAALTLVLHLLNPDDLLIAPHDCYGRSYKLIDTLAEKGHFKAQFADLYSDEAVDEIIALKPKMIIIESPSNPVMRVSDIQSIVKKAKDIGALVVCDNTFLSPILQRPLELGADIVFSSTTKFMNGHSDVVGGCITANDEKILLDLHTWNNALGTIGSPFDSSQTLRGLRTLEIRVQRAQENAMKIAAFLDGHEQVAALHYPGMASHPHHKVAKAQQDGFGALVSFEIKGGYENANAFLGALRVFCLAQSLGGTESLVSHPASMTHVSMGAEARAKAGVTDTLIRLSVGIEHVDDLIADLEKGFAKSA